MYPFAASSSRNVKTNCEISISGNGRPPLSAGLRTMLKSWKGVGELELNKATEATSVPRTPADMHVSLHSSTFYMSKTEVKPRARKGGESLNRPLT